MASFGEKPRSRERKERGERIDFSTNLDTSEGGAGRVGRGRRRRKLSQLANAVVSVDRSISGPKFREQRRQLRGGMDGFKNGKSYFRIFG